ncbi:MAG: LamG-like jellyroll fold domain-containing protein [bacterium]
MSCLVAGHPSLLFDQQGLVPGASAIYLFDDQARNLLKYSQQFDNAAWVKDDSVVTPNATTAQDGTTTMDLLKEGSSVDTYHRVLQNVNLAAFAANQVVTFSVFVKAKERTKLEMWAYDKSKSVQRSNFDLVTGAAALEVGGVTATMQETHTGSGIYRCIFTYSVGTGANTTGLVYILLHNGDSEYYTGDGASGLYLWGAQLEPGTVATTYYPTTDKQMLMDTSKPRKNLLLPNQANGSEDGSVGVWQSDGATITSSTEQARSGLRSLKFVTDNAANYEGAYLARPIGSLEPSKSYTVSGYILGVAGTVRLRIEEQTDAGEYVSAANSATLTLDGTFQRISVSRAFGATGRMAQIYIQTVGRQGIIFYVDDLQFEEGSAATAWEAPPNIGILGSGTGADTNDPTPTGKGLSFTADDYVMLGKPTLYSPNGFTMEYVFYLGAAGADDSYAALGSRYIANGYALLIYFNGGGVRDLEFYIHSVGDITFNAATVPLQEWHLVTVTYDGSTVRMYWDGGLLPKTLSLDHADINVATGDTIGGAWGGENGLQIAYSGKYARGLTQAEITRNYNFLKSYLAPRGVALS